MYIGTYIHISLSIFTIIVRNNQKKIDEKKNHRDFFELHVVVRSQSK